MPPSNPVPCPRSFRTRPDTNTMLTRVWLSKHASCIIPAGARDTSSEFCQKRKIPPPSGLDGRVGRRSPREGRNTLASCKLNGRNARAVGLPSPRNPANKLIVKQRALVVLCTHLMWYHPESDMSAPQSIPVVTCDKGCVGTPRRQTMLSLLVYLW